MEDYKMLIILLAEKQASKTYGCQSVTSIIVELSFSVNNIH